MKTHKQTWWDKDIRKKFNEFKSWVGPTTQPSKKWARDYITENQYKTVADIGCGICNEHEEYKKIDPDILWTGVDSSYFLSSKALYNGARVINREGHDTGLSNGMFDAVYSRHVLEHQKHYKPILKEMIRIGSKVVINIFFIKPREEEIIHYDEKQNLYHNTFSKPEIEKYLEEHPKVKNIMWMSISGSPSEEALIIKLV